MNFTTSPSSPRVLPSRKTEVNPTLTFVPSVLLCLLSWGLGGVPWLTDVGFLALALACAVRLVKELLQIGETRAIGRLVLFGGVLVWFCHDYFTNWFGADFPRGTDFDPLLLARASAMHCLFVATMVAGWHTLPEGTLLQRLFQKIPEPHPRSRYLLLVIILFVIGLIPAVLSAGTGGVAFQRTGNLNYNWGAYMHELTKVGRFGALVAAAHALLVSRSNLARLVSWSIWLYWVNEAFLTGRRGNVVFVVMPVGLLLLLAYRKTRKGRSLSSTRQFALAAALLVASLAVIQVQGHFRDTRGGLRYENISRVNLTALRGNDMFSTTLVGFSLIPASRPHFFDTIPGEVLVRPVPEFAFRFVIHPIPRALWRDKPVDPVWAWYRFVVAGASGVGGTTISTGLVGWWYFRFGIFGVLQGGFLFGWLYRGGDKLFVTFADSPIRLLVSLAYFAWLFRCFRDVAIMEFYGFAISAILLRFLIPTIGSKSQSSRPTAPFRR